jgi:hypothetical protein
MISVLLAFDWGFLIEKLVLIIGIVSVSLLVAMYETYAERKLAAVIQDRRGHPSDLQQIPFYFRSRSCNAHRHDDFSSYSMG